ncbi:hypothetical protein AVEN_54830-1 [Araneus ventricosus]|uniref:Uncharacterized protein n=1 Tax=Araneus ventricosus TaxID=182803 RepID=A0A4Y2EWR1_ARAVE|nr:hypothetical protein AVEN_54830-1 [Araneus ventricosus]
MAVSSAHPLRQAIHGRSFDANPSVTGHPTAPTFPLPSKREPPTCSDFFSSERASPLLLHTGSISAFSSNSRQFKWSGWISDWLHIETFKHNTPILIGFRTDDGFWSGVTEFVWNGAFVNVQPKEEQPN